MHGATIRLLPLLAVLFGVPSFGCALADHDDGATDDDDVAETSDAVTTSCTSKLPKISIESRRSLATRWVMNGIKASSTPADENTYRTDVPTVRTGDVAQLLLTQEGKFRYQFLADEGGGKASFRQASGTFTLHQAQAGRYVVAMAGDDGVCRVRTLREAKQSGVDRSKAAWPFALEMAMNGAWIHYGALPTSTPCRWTYDGSGGTRQAFVFGCSKGYEGAF